MVNIADLVDVTFCCFLARILALVVNASLVQWTFRVASTFEQHASDLRVAAEAWWTIANCSVIDSSAFRSCSTLVSTAHWHALSVVASMLSGAFVVRGAADLHASNLGVALETLFASADRFMALDTTKRVLTAVARIATETVDARFLCTAIRVGNATDDSNRLDWFASSTSAADVTFWADADHGSDWCRWNYLTLRWKIAWSQLKAWIFTFVVDTSES